MLKHRKTRLTITVGNTHAEFTTIWDMKRLHRKRDSGLANLWAVGWF